MKTSRIKYLKIIQDSYKKGMITKKKWKQERKECRERPKSSI